MALKDPVYWPVVLKFPNLPSSLPLSDNSTRRLNLGSTRMDRDTSGAKPVSSTEALSPLTEALTAPPKIAFVVMVLKSKFETRPVSLMPAS